LLAIAHSGPCVSASSKTSRSAIRHLVVPFDRRTGAGKPVPVLSQRQIVATPTP
jgi:hypothetical protein